MQQRVVELISRVSNEEVTEELLHVNDDLNNIFLRYERYERYRSGRAAQNNGLMEMLSEATEDNLIDLTPGSPAVVSLRATSTPPSSIPPVTAPRAGATASPARTLIQDPTSGPSTLSTQLAGLDVGGVSVSGTLSSLSGHNPGDDFDMFAQTRTSSLADQRKNVKYEDPRALGGLASALDVRQQNATGGLRVIGDDNPELELPIDSWLITQGMVRTPSSVSSPYVQSPHHPYPPTPLAPSSPPPPSIHPSIPLTIHIPALLNQLAPTVEWRHVRKSQTTPPIVQYPHNDE
nr:TOM1-like protein 2 isoform X1 [Oncorhynchus nerka]